VRASQEQASCPQGCWLALKERATNTDLRVTRQYAFGNYLFVCTHAPFRERPRCKVWQRGLVAFRHEGLPPIGVRLTVRAALWAHSNLSRSPDSVLGLVTIWILQSNPRQLGERALDLDFQKSNCHFLGRSERYKV
jgi:hypothetical protein